MFGRTHEAAAVEREDARHGIEEDQPLPGHGEGRRLELHLREVEDGRQEKPGQLADADDVLGVAEEDVERADETRDARAEREMGEEGGQEPEKPRAELQRLGGGQVEDEGDEGQEKVDAVREGRRKRQDRAGEIDFFDEVGVSRDGVEGVVERSGGEAPDDDSGNQELEIVRLPLVEFEDMGEDRVHQDGERRRQERPEKAKDGPLVADLQVALHERDQKHQAQRGANLGQQACFFGTHGNIILVSAERGKQNRTSGALVFRKSFTFDRKSV